MNDQMMTVDQVADRLGVKKSWVYDQWERLGIPFRRLGNQLRCRPAELEAWIDDQQAA